MHQYIYMELLLYFFVKKVFVRYGTVSKFGKNWKKATRFDTNTFHSDRLSIHSFFVSVPYLSHARFWRHAIITGM